tara:strand:+ start:1252 stop:1599 length:348 start_codon:yes stop_codon:yes gene_type:complete
MEKVFDKRRVEEFRVDAIEALKELEIKYGVVIKLGTLTYDKTSVRGKMTALKGKREKEFDRNDFNIGDTVKINHTKALPTSVFEIIKMNKKNFKVMNVENRRLVNVPPQLLIKLF